MDPNTKLTATINAGWVESHRPGTRWDGADGKVYVVDDVQEASLMDDDDRRIGAPVWVVHSHLAED